VAINTWKAVNANVLSPLEAEHGRRKLKPVIAAYVSSEHAATAPVLRPYAARYWHRHTYGFCHCQGPTRPTSAGLGYAPGRGIVVRRHCDFQSYVTSLC
jgi:hypothetical protein